MIGFLDDYIKIVMRRSLGLRAWQKLVLQLLVTIIFVYYYTPAPALRDADADPVYRRNCIRKIYCSAGMAVYSVFIFCHGGNCQRHKFYGWTGWACIQRDAAYCCVFTVVAIGTGSTVAPVCAAVAGALMGFLVFNVYPASVFMGDTGSLALGGFVASTALLLKMPLYILIVGMIYLVEVLSVILQVGYFKITHGRRIFKMAPIHHHFEQSGWSETKVVAVFSIVTALFCLIALAAL